MCSNDVVKGYLDVKISARSRRGLTPWKAWQRQWCEIKRLDGTDNGVQLKFKSNSEGNILSCLEIPRSASICRTESRTKQYAFGVFNLGRKKNPILYLSGVSESDSQEWISAIRRMLCIASYIPVGDLNFRVSIVDNNHSRAAGLFGLFGVLSVNTQEIVVSDPCTGEPKISWKWYNFHQFHLQATSQPVDEKRIIVMHTSGEFPAGPGQIYLFTKDGSQLLHHLICHGNVVKTSPGAASIRRFSRSEGDLYCSHSSAPAPDSPLCFRSQTGSDDSGVRVSIASDDSEYAEKYKTESKLFNSGIDYIVMKTPGGSETEDSCPDLAASTSSECRKNNLPRNESGLSLSSGVYEEIPDNYDSKIDKHASHVYENPLDIILDKKYDKHFKPPPLPPRTMEFSPIGSDRPNFLLPFKQRCNTLPAKDLSKISQTFTSESEYVIMTPSKTLKKPKKMLPESFYMPMSPVVNLKNKIYESYYISMNGNGRKT